MTRWSTTFLALVAATVFGLSLEVGAFGSIAGQNQPVSAAEPPAVSTASQPSDFTPISSPVNLCKPLENKDVLEPCYLNPQTGRFWTRDVFEGILCDPPFAPGGKVGDEF